MSDWRAMSSPEVKFQVDEHGRITYRVTNEGILLSKEEKELIIDRFTALQTENAHLRAKNDKLQELVHDMWGVMWACAEQRCTHRENGCFRVNGNGDTPKGSGVCWFANRMHGLEAETSE